MFSLNESNRYYLYPYPTDMRKSFYTLSGIVTNQMGKNVRDGDAFIFINANCTCMKILHMEYGQLVVYQIILPEGSFRLPDIDENTGALHTSWQNLISMLQNVDKSLIFKRKKW